MNDQQSETLGRAVLGLQALLEAERLRQDELSRRVNTLYRISFAVFAILLVSMSFMVIALALLLPPLVKAVDQMNAYFAEITADMEVMQQRMHAMRYSMESMPDIVRNMDAMNESTTNMSGRVAEMRQAMSRMTADIETMSASVSDLRHSFGLMNVTVANMQGNVQHMSAPMRMFNLFNPFSR